MVKKTHKWKSAAAKRVFSVAGDCSSMQLAIRKIVTSLLDGVQLIPTDLPTVGKKLNVSSITAEKMLVIGELRQRKNGQLIVAYSDSLVEARRNFTVAHELGHAFMLSTGENAPTVGEELEAICDQFAAELLMPFEQFSEKMKQGFNVDQLATVFHVSRQSATIRVETILREKTLGNSQLSCS